ncbi:MAG: SET domain-containing protein-lysine N-methyltransferase, partial [Gammaproteobacteria bacterium]|nr:SET domain-containing protein-lysine N-methyltransferase [Gammaproteobacteria bacterium]
MARAIQGPSSILLGADPITCKNLEDNELSRVAVAEGDYDKTLLKDEYTEVLSYDGSDGEIVQCFIQVEGEYGHERCKEAGEATFEAPAPSPAPAPAPALLWFESMQRNCKTNILGATNDELELLEMPSLVAEIRKITRELEAAYDGTEFGTGYNSNDALNHVIEPEHVSMDQFLDLGFMVRTRRMLLDNKNVMMPLFDMFNNAESDDAASVQFFYNATHVGFRAKRRIWSGDELRWNYIMGQRASPDTIFLTWQYVTARTDVLFAEDEQNLNILFGSLSGVDLFSNAIDYI